MGNKEKIKDRVKKAKKKDIKESFERAPRGFKQETELTDDNIDAIIIHLKNEKDNILDSKKSFSKIATEISSELNIFVKEKTVVDIYREMKERYNAIVAEETPEPTI